KRRFVFDSDPRCIGPCPFVPEGRIAGTVQGLGQIADAVVSRGFLGGRTRRRGRVSRVVARRTMSLRAIALILTMPLAAQVTSARIERPTGEPGNWVTYSGNYQGHRFSPLDQI